MSENWNFYFCQVEGKPASIMLDMDLKVPACEKSEMVYLRLYMRVPRSDGLSSSDEMPFLKAIEDSLQRAAERANAIYVGRNTTDGFRDHVYYTARGTAVETALATALAKYPEYKFEIGSRPDPEWRIYREFLYPDERQRQSMENRSVYDALERNGDALSVAREIDHWIYFPDVSSRGAFVESSAKHGFKVRKYSEPHKEQPAYGVQIFRSDIPNSAQFDPVVLLLFDLAAEVNGDYDGWETLALNEHAP